MSIYDTISVGPVSFTPTGIYADHVQVDIGAVSGDSKDVPYIQDGSLYIPVRTWEGMQERMLRTVASQTVVVK